MTVTGLMTLLVIAGFGTSGAADPVERPRPQPVLLVPIVTRELQAPLFVTHAGDGSGRLYVVEQGGTIRVVDRDSSIPQPFLDIRDLVSTKGPEQGLLGLAFHPDYGRNGRFLVNYNRREDGATVLAEYRQQPQSRQGGAEGRIVMVVPQPYANHNGGMVAFGPDGFLYIGRGDGGSRGDPQNRAQNPHELLGKLLRIDVDRATPDAIPPDNPFAMEGGRPEIFALGLRNPWRFSFDRATGDLWLADVGQNKWEEINFITKGSNYGWRVMEGAHCYNPERDCPRKGLTLPSLEYFHEKGRCSITGGYVYRGKQIPWLRSTYLFGDYCSGELFAMPIASEGQVMREPNVLMRTGFRIASFGEDEDGEVYLVDHRGGLYRIASAPASR